MNEKTASARSTKLLFPFAAIVVAGSALGFSADQFYNTSPLSALSSAVATTATTSEAAVPAKPQVLHVARPDSLKAIYMTQCVVGTPSFRAELVDFIDQTELNAVVIDIKDFTGKIAFPTDNPKLADAVSDACGARDMKSYLEMLHEKGIYVIGRITVFQDPYYTSVHPELAVQKKSGGVWKDHKGLAFVDVGARPFWEHIVEIGKESYELGFDELNFDYIRYPSDGNMQEAHYSHSDGKLKAVALEEFYRYLDEQLGDTGALLSADLFGYVTVQHDDLGIGQILERALPYFDYIYPMTYPSHYNAGFAGLADVNSDPYKIIYRSLVEAVEREAATTTRHQSFAYEPVASTSPQLYEKPAYRGKVVPWLQSFDYPVHYSPAMVQAQIQATYDSGVDSWIFWDAGNKYSSLRSVLSSSASAQNPL
jgi:hypothetical protein